MLPILGEPAVVGMWSFLDGNSGSTPGPVPVLFDDRHSCYLGNLGQIPIITRSVNSRIDIVQFAVIDPREVDRHSVIDVTRL